VKLGKGIKRSVAAEIAGVKRVEILRGTAGIARKPRDMKFSDARQKFEAWADMNTKPRTARYYRDCLRWLAKTFEGKRLSEISPFLVEKHRHWRIHSNAKIRANRETATLRALFNRCKAWKLYEGNNPVDEVKISQEPKQRLRFLEPEDEQRLLEAAAEPLRSMILVGIHCGLRLRSEALTLQWQDVDLSRRTLTVLSSYAKSKKARTVPLNSAVHAALTYLRGQRRSEYVFAKQNGMPYYSIRTAFETACHRAGLLDVTPHTLRHSFATRLLENGVDAKTVAELGGWSRLEMLDRYTHTSSKRKAEAVERLTHEFHNAFHNSGKTDYATNIITLQNYTRGEVAERPKATVC
jgi:integrase